MILVIIFRTVFLHAALFYNYSDFYVKKTDCHLCVGRPRFRKRDTLQDAQITLQSYSLLSRRHSQRESEVRLS